MFIKRFIRYNISYLEQINSNQKHKKLSVIDRFPINSCINRKLCKYESYVRKMLAYLVYKPRKVYFLHTSPELIYQRKQELSVEEIKNYMKYEISIMKNKNIDYEIFDCSKSVNEIAVEIIKDIFTNFPNTIRGYER